MNGPVIQEQAQTLDGRQRLVAAPDHVDRRGLDVSVLRDDGRFFAQVHQTAASAPDIPRRSRWADAMAARSGAARRMAYACPSAASTASYRWTQASRVSRRAECRAARASAG